MSDPRYTEPHDDRRDRTLFGTARSDGALWGWIAAIAVLVLVAFVLIAGWNNTGSDTAITTPAPPATTSPAPSGTTGSGTTSPQPPPPSSQPSAPTQNNRPAPQQ